MAANLARAVECQRGARGRQGQGDPIDRFLDQEWQPLTVCMRGVLRMDGAVRWLKRTSRRLLGKQSAGTVVPATKVDCSGLSCEQRVEICNVFRRRRASYRWFFQPVARAIDACLRRAQWPRAQRRPVRGGAAARLTWACAGRDGCVLDIDSRPRFCGLKGRISSPACHSDLVCQASFLGQPLGCLRLQ